jgi:1,2-dihydroxy-3-keto-5-methylthiopentene dioxygenase
MSRLRIFADNAPDTPLFDSSDGDAIARELQEIGVTFERWQAAQPIAPGASPEDVMAAYRADIDRLVAERGFKSVDVVSIAPDNPKREEMRARVLDEHFHKEDEVRFFVAGSGLFTLHVGDRVYEIECVKDDLIAVPDGTTHWFDMGPEPSFVAIRFFTEPEEYTASGCPAACQARRAGATSGYSGAVKSPSR